MAERQSEHPLDEGLYLLSFWTLVWGPAVAAAFLHANPAFWLVTIGCWIAIFTLEKRMFAAVRRYRTIIVALAAFFAGYCWYAFLEQNSEEFKTRAAAIEACAQFKSCVDGVELGGFEITPHYSDGSSGGLPTPATQSPPGQPQRQSGNLSLEAMKAMPAPPALSTLTPAERDLITKAGATLPAPLDPQGTLNEMWRRAHAPPEKQSDLKQP